MPTPRNREVILASSPTGGPQYYVRVPIAWLHCLRVSLLRVDRAPTAHPVSGYIRQPASGWEVPRIESPEQEAQAISRKSTVVRRPVLRE
ncbi:hypothetical protein PISMIDRAFT_356143 [Pisolithus microcarpus 441]|uniref:Uncharacterized protein n=1 Tax=Pisolithus microcarpus 441 TaxID=765257 RepID=A0A0C9Z7E3_9AGAM|nr:hypothetical protein PISMIDRAFT_356143 [Pisolithus microcarpus 441]